MQPGQQKITQFDEVTSTQSGDIIPIVRGGQNKKISVENFTGVLPEGWLTPAEAWTFASFGNGVGVITIPEGNINRYPNGTRVWFKQGAPTATNRYGIVIASTTTTLTVAMIAGTVLSNLTIQQPAISSEVAPRTSENVDFTTQNRMPDYANDNIISGTPTSAFTDRLLFTAPRDAWFTYAAYGHGVAEWYARSGIGAAAADNKVVFSGVGARIGFTIMVPRGGRVYLTRGTVAGDTVSWCPIDKTSF